MADRSKWQGGSGREYEYWIFPVGHGFSEQPANYIFAKVQTNEWTPIYIGETGDLSDRFDNHHKMSCIRENGATHIHAHKSSANESERKAEEADLIANYNKVCND